jgi:hypothetical protein
MEEQPVTLFTLANGAAAELFDEELTKVVQNILDPNTEADTVREISLKVRIVPDDTRRMASVSVQVVSKIGPIIGAATQFFFGKRAGQCFAVEANPSQGQLFDKPAKPIGVNFETGKVRDGDNQR